MAEQQPKTDIELVEGTATTEEKMPTTKGDNPLMRSKADELSVWQSAMMFKRVGLIAMTAAFCASLDGYRKRLFAEPNYQLIPLTWACRNQSERRYYSQQGIH